MNTREAMRASNHHVLEAQLILLLFGDGFGFHEAYAHVNDYCKIIFGSITPTGIVIIRRRLRALEVSNVQ